MIALLGNLLFASAALATPSFLQVEKNLASHHRSQLDQSAVAASTPNISYTVDWSGAAIYSNNDTIDTVTATFVAPTPQGTNGSASVWVGLSGMSSILQTGIIVETSDNGTASYSAWYEWFPDGEVPFSNFPINEGDVIQATVVAYSDTSGVTILYNQSTGQIASQNLTSNYTLDGQQAEWIVEDFAVNGGLVPFADFGTVTFYNASANQGAYPVTDASVLIYLGQNNVVLATPSFDGPNLVVQYTGPSS